MPLQSTMTTALTGMQGAETTIDVVGNNVANASTVGFKQSSVSFATQFFRTQSIGSAPSTSSGGTNPRQTGLGVKVAEITPDFTPGTIEISSNPLDLAIQGDGFFIVEGSQGEQLYTRNGQFKTNSNNEIVTITGQRVLGYSVDANFEIEPTVLTPLQIPLGSAAVAQATENVVMKGSLNPNEDPSSIRPGIIQSGVLSDGSSEYPTTTINGSPVNRPDDSTTVGSTAGVGIDSGNYTYRVTFVDVNGNESSASALTPALLVAGSVASIDLSNLPQPADTAAFPNIRIYRNDSNVNNEYRLVTTLAAGTPSHTDTATDASIAGNALLDDTGLANGSYSYYVTYYNSLNGDESRPASRIGPLTASDVSAPRIRLANLPTPLTGEYDSVRIYRNTSTNSTSYRLVDTVAPGGSYIDNTPDAAIASAEEVNLEGPPIEFGTRLIDVVSRDGANYTELFQVGELSFNGSKAERPVGERTLTITATTSVGELLAFMEDAMGVVKDADEDTFPDTGISYGGNVTADSRLELTSNMGEQNALGVDLSSFRLTPTATGIAQSVDLPFTNSQDAVGEGATADVVVYDSLGTPLRVRISTVLEDVSPSGAKFRWIATSSDNDSLTEASTLVGTGVITTDGSGKFISATQDRVAIDRGNSPANSPLEFRFDFAQVTGLSPQDANTQSSLSATSQDGFSAGTLTSFLISDTGRINGLFSNGSQRDLGQIRMATFANNSGLKQLGDNLFANGVNSGLPIYGDPGSNGAGAVQGGAVELSNTDIGQNLIDLILASTQYRGGARVITTVQQLLDELMALRR
jgi:flagellar hook protein FlgE